MNAEAAPAGDIPPPGRLDRSSNSAFVMTVAPSSQHGMSRVEAFAKLAAAAVMAMAIPPLSGPAAAQAPAATAQAPAAGLAGLWTAKKRFGPDARGTLIISRTGQGYRADMVGRVIAVRSEGGELAFDLPNGQGTFRGRMAGRAILGHWYRPGTDVNGESASPVRLEPDGSGGWRGQVGPLQDDFTYFLLATARQDGSWDVVLRNPERDFGAALGAQQLVRDGNVVMLMGKRRRDREEREIGRGLYDPESGQFTLALPRGGTFEFARDGDESGLYPRGKNPAPYSYVPPPKRDDGWPTASLADVNIDRAAIEKYIQGVLNEPQATIGAPQVHGLLIARHGKLVLEEYFHGIDRDYLHNTRSASKSITAVLVGAAIRAGAPLKLSSPVYQVMNGGSYPAGLDLAKRRMTLENLLTMSSGFFCDDNNDEAPGNENGMWDRPEQPDFYRYYMSVPLDRKPGDKAVYCSGDPNLALGMLGRAAGQDPMFLFDRLLAGPMKIDDYEWTLDYARQPFGGGGMFLKLRDFMKLGQLMLNGGTWDGRRILSRDFVSQAIAPHFDLEGRKYGFLWWSDDIPYKGRILHTFMALGAGGQTIWVFPQLDLVVASYSGSFASAGWKRAVVLDDLLPAIVEESPGKQPAR